MLQDNHKRGEQGFQIGRGWDEGMILALTTSRRTCLFFLFFLRFIFNWNINCFIMCWFLPYNNMNESSILFCIHSYSSSLCGKTCPWFIKTVSWLLYLTAWKFVMWPEIHFTEKLSMASSFCLKRNICIA